MKRAPQPTPGVRLKGSLNPHRDGDVLLGFEKYEPELGCCKCEDLTKCGVCWVFCLGCVANFVLPGAGLLGFIPCCCRSCKQPYQRPFYGPLPPPPPPPPVPPVGQDEDARRAQLEQLQREHAADIADWQQRYNQALWDAQHRGRDVQYRPPHDQEMDAAQQEGVNIDHHHINVVVVPRSRNGSPYKHSQTYC